MSDIDKFHEWVDTQSQLALREYMFAQAVWQARGELDAVRIKELEAEILGWQGKSIEREQHLQIANSAVEELAAKLDNARVALEYIDKDLCYRWITESNSIKAHELISMIMMESSKALGKLK